MTDDAELAATAWCSIQGDPTLLDGLTFGQLDDLMTYVAGIADVFRTIPIGLLKRLTTQSDNPDVLGMIENYRELLNREEVRKVLDDLVGGTDG